MTTPGETDGQQPTARSVGGSPFAPDNLAPVVDHELLAGFIAGRLAPDTAELVADLVLMYRSWNEALDEMLPPEPGASVTPPQS